MIESAYWNGHIVGSLLKLHDQETKLEQGKFEKNITKTYEIQKEEWKPEDIRDMQGYIDHSSNLYLYVLYTESKLYSEVKNHLLRIFLYVLQVGIDFLTLKKLMINI